MIMYIRKTDFFLVPQQPVAIQEEQFHQLNYSHVIDLYINILLCKGSIKFDYVYI